MRAAKTAALIFLVPVLAFGLRRTQLNETVESSVAGTLDRRYTPGQWESLFLIPELMGKGNGLRCCCDSDIRPESETLCRYITEKSNGKCPRGDLGRGWSQTHSAQRSHGVLNPERCILTGDEIIDPLPASAERLRCEVQEELDAKIFPPEHTGEWAMRKALANVPGIGKLFLGLEDIHVMEVDMSILLTRKSDRTFSFEIAGPDGNGDAVVKAWIQGIHLHLPESSAGRVFNAIATLEHIGANILTLGLAGKNYGKIDNSPVDVQLKMKGDFRLGETGEWEIVPGSDSQSASVSIGSGGVLMGMVNLAIEFLGGMDQIFFDVIWPIVKQSFPPSLGRAFETVPHESGEVENRLKVSARCPDTEGKTCPSHMLALDIKQITSIRTTPHTIIKDLLRQGVFEQVQVLEALANNAMKAYDEGQHVFDGMNMRCRLGVEVAPEKGIVMTESPRLDLPYSLLAHILGPAVPFGDFISDDGKIEAKGSCDIKDGVVSVNDLGLQGLSLPIGSDMGRIEVGVTVENLQIEAVDENDEAADIDFIFGKDSPLSVHAPGFQVGLDFEDGLSLKPKADLQVMPAESDDIAWKLALTPTYVMEVLENVAHGLMVPVSVRTAMQEKADGIVPKQFERPYALMKEPLNLTSLMQDVNVEVDLHTNSTKSEGWDLVDVQTSVSITGSLSLPASLWRSLTSNDEDTGFLHVSLPGHYGELGKGDTMPSEPAILVLSCGSLWLYDPDSNLFFPGLNEKPFDKIIKVLDLGDEDTQNMLAYKEGPSSCIQMDEQLGWLGTKRSYFCSADDSAMTNLREALSLQLKRFGDAAKRWPKSCVPGPNGSPPTCLGNPDGTWFKQWSPIDRSTWTPARMPPTPDEVKPPGEQWFAAIDMFRSSRA